MDPKRPLPFFSESTLSPFLSRKNFLWWFTLPLLVTAVSLFSHFNVRANHPYSNGTESGFGEESVAFEQTEAGFSTTIEDTLHMERISFAPRGDGLGYVIRFHQSTRLDSFSLIQPASDLIQLELFHSNIDTLGIQFPTYNEDVQEVRLYKLENSYGVDIYLGQQLKVISNAYPDMQSQDLLVALTYSTPREVEVFTQQFLARNWYLSINPDNALDILAPAVPSPTNLDQEYEQVKGKLRFDTVIIDPGHGGHDPGNVGYRNAREKDVVLSISKKLGSYIEEYLPDVKVIYTRETDRYVDLEERGSIANRAEGDLFVSIHADGWTSSSVYGSSVFFLGLHRSDAAFEVMKRENSVFTNHSDELFNLTEEDLLIYELAHSGYIATSERIAYMIEDQFRTRANRKSRGVKQAGFVVLYQASMPAVLIETGFLSNPAEQRFLTSDYGQSIIASAIFRAIRDYKQEYEKTQN